MIIFDYSNEKKLRIHVPINHIDRIKNNVPMPTGHQTSNSLSMQETKPWGPVVAASILL